MLRVRTKHARLFWCEPGGARWLGAALALLAACTGAARDGRGGASDGAVDDAPGLDASPVSPDAAGLDAPEADDAGPSPIDAGPPIDAGTPRDAGGGGTALTPGTTTVTVTAGGRMRTILVHVPAGWAAGDPGLVALHGNGDDPAGFLAWTGLRAEADARGFAIAAPAAISGHFMGVDWDAYTTPSSSNIDVAVTFAARDLLLDGGASRSRMYLLGHSQGGFLAYHAAMAGSTTFGAVHIASSGMPVSGLAAMAERRIPFDILVGSSDSLASIARMTRDDLEMRGFEVRFTEVPGAGHCCPIMGRVPDIWAWLDARPL